MAETNSLDLKYFFRIFVAVLIIGCLFGLAAQRLWAVNDATWDMGSGMFTASSSEPCLTSCSGHTITGTASSSDYCIKIVSGSHDLSLNSININPSGSGLEPIYISNGASVNIHLNGNNKVARNNNNYPTLTINGTATIDGSGTLTVPTGNSVDVNNSLTLNRGNYEIKGTTDVADNTGVLTINGGRGSFNTIDTNTSGTLILNGGTYVYERIDSITDITLTGGSHLFPRGSTTVRLNADPAYRSTITLLLNGSPVKNVLVSNIEANPAPAPISFNLAQPPVVSRLGELPVSRFVTMKRTGSVGYNTTDTYTDGSGKLYLWFPADTSLTSITAGGVTYIGSLVTGADDNKTATFYGTSVVDSPSSPTPTVPPLSFGSTRRSEPPQPGFTYVEVVKQWRGVSAEERPKSVMVTLYADGVKKYSVPLSDHNNWLVRWSDLPDNVRYTVDEETPEGYEQSIEVRDKLYIITNTKITAAPADEPTRNPNTGTGDMTT